jgi:hypothetical protein
VDTASIALLDVNLVHQICPNVIHASMDTRMKIIHVRKNAKLIVSPVMIHAQSVIQDSCQFKEIAFHV